MNNSKIDERAVKIAEKRLARQIRLREDKAHGWYLQGYYEAICDFIWDYTGTPLKSLDWEAYIEGQVKKGKLKFAAIPIKIIKNNDKGGPK